MKLFILMRKLLIAIFCVSLFAFSCTFAAEKTAEPQSDVNTLQKQILLDKNNPKLYYDLSREYSALKKPAKAMNAINEAVRLDPKNVTYLKNGSPRLCVDRLKSCHSWIEPFQA